MARIYVLSDPRTGEIRYVGWTSKPLESRLRQHVRERSSCHRVWWIRSLQREGLSPTIQLLQTVPDSDWNQAEVYWISFFRSLGYRLVNGTDGGQGKLGYRASEATKEKLSQATKKRFENPAAREAISQVHSGKTISSEHRAKVSEATRLRWARWRAEGGVTSDETREKISRARKGVALSEEHRAKIKAYQKGRPKSAEHRAKISQAHQARKGQA